MPSVQFIAKRSLQSGNNVDDVLTLDFNASSQNPEDEINSNELASMDNDIEAVLDNITQYWSIKVVPILYSTLPAWREFLHSVAAREKFEFDPTGTESVPSGVSITCTLESNKFNYERDGLGTMAMTLSMKFKEE